MVHPFDKLTVDTPAGSYVIASHYDLDAGLRLTSPQRSG